MLCQHSLRLTGVTGDPASPVHRLDARTKIVGLITVTLVAVSAPAPLWPVYLACALVLAVIAAVARVSPREIWRRARFILPLVLAVAVFVPLLRTGGQRYELGPLTLHEAGLLVLAAVAAKATLGTVGAVLLGATTPFPAVLRGLEQMRVPRLFVMIAAFMYRYLFVIVDELQRMRAALASRAYQPRTLLGAAPLGRMATAMFLRTYGRGERVYLAMLARGYAGAMPQLHRSALGRADVVFLATVAVALLPLRVIAGLSG